MELGNTRFTMFKLGFGVEGESYIGRDIARTSRIQRELAISRRILA